MEGRYLFRGKRIDNQDWIFGFLSIHKTGKAFIRPIDGNALSSKEVDKDTICQCTELKDKNGNLIWENDILMCNENKKDLVTAVYGEFAVIDAETLKIVDNVIGWHYEVIPTDGLSKMEPFCLSMPLTNEYVELCKMEVIGNIFDNKGLL